MMSCPTLVLRIAGATLAVAAMVGCAPPRTASTTVTAAEVSSDSEAQPEPREAPRPPAMDRADTPPETVPAPAGHRVCRSQSPLEGTIELYLDWEGSEAKGTLRTIAPSGAVTDRRVRAERHQKLIVADDPSSIDLAVHAAIVGERNGKYYMRAGESSQAWTVCE